MPRYINNPVAFTKRSIRYEKTKKNKFIGRVYIPADQWKYLQWIVDGGVKAWNQSPTGIGVPTENIKLNKSGNIVGRKNRGALWREGKGSRKGEFVINKLDARKRNGTAGVYKRIGRGKNKRIALLVEFHDSVF